MLAARLTIVQVLDMYQLSMSITSFAPGRDPEQWTQQPVVLTQDDIGNSEDDFSTIMRLIALWSEMTINP